MNDQITPEKIEALRNLLREKMAAAKAAGWEIRRRPDGWIEIQPDGVPCCCAIGSLIFDVPHVNGLPLFAQKDLVQAILATVMGAMTISEAEVAIQEIVTGFDNGINHPARGALHDMGHDLAVEFVDGPGATA